MDFNSVAGKYEKISITQKTASQQLLDYMDCDKYNNILDIGCASGVNTERLLNILDEKGVYVGVDPSQKMIDQAISKKIPNSKFICSSFEKATIADTYELIFCNSVFYYISDTTIFFKKCKDLLSKNGIISIQAQTRMCSIFEDALEFAKNHKKTKEVMKYFNFPANLYSEHEYLEMLDKQPYFKVNKYKCCVDYHNVSIKKAIDIFESGPAIPCLSELAYSIPIKQSFKKDLLDVIKKYIKEKAQNGMVSLNSPRIYIILSKI